MNIKSRTLWTTIVALLVATAALVSVSAQTKPATEGRQGRGQGMGPGPAMPVLQRLTLTDEQREKIRWILEQQSKSTEAPAQKVTELQRELQLAVFADSPDRAKIDQLKADLKKAEAAALDARIETELKVAEVLTPEQRTQARQSQAGRGRRPRR